MKITTEEFEIMSDKVIDWADVQSMSVHGSKLAIVLSNHQNIEIPDLSPTKIDLAFRCYKNYLNQHSTKRHITP